MDDTMYGHELMAWMLKEAFKATESEFRGAIVSNGNGGVTTIVKAEEFGQWIIDTIGLDKFKEHMESKKCK